jgi:hypothetical protein
MEGHLHRGPNSWQMKSARRSLTLSPALAATHRCTTSPSTGYDEAFTEQSGGPTPDIRAIRRRCRRSWPDCRPCASAACCATLGGQRQSCKPNPGQPGAPVGESGAARDPARRHAAVASARDSAGATNSAAERRRESAESDVETDGIETETEDLFGELDEDFEDEDEFAGLDGLSLGECMDLVRRDFARCFTGKARVPETAAPGEPPDGDEPSGQGRPRPGGETAAPLSSATEGRPAGLRAWHQPRAATLTPGDSRADATAESPAPPPARGRDPP